MSTEDAPVLKVIFFYSDRSENSVILSDIFAVIAETFKHKPLVFARINIDRNEIPELHDIGIPSLITIRHYGDENAQNYEGVWSEEDMKEWIYLRAEEFKVSKAKARTTNSTKVVDTEQRQEL